MTLACQLWVTVMFPLRPLGKKAPLATPAAEAVAPAVLERLP